MPNFDHRPNKVGGALVLEKKEGRIQSGMGSEGGSSSGGEKEKITTANSSRKFQEVIRMIGCTIPPGTDL